MDGGGTILVIGLKPGRKYLVEADDEESARDSWSEGELIHTNDEALDTEVLSVKEA